MVQPGMRMPCDHTGSGEDQTGEAGGRTGTGAGAGVLADRIAAVLVNHEPGWRLPLSSELARRHNASAYQVRAAVDSLLARRLVRRSPDGRLYRSSPADYLVSLEGMAGLGVTVDPMGGDLTCLSFGSSRRPAAEHTAYALRVRPGEPVGVLRLTWALDGAPAAVSTTYLAGRLAEPPALADWLMAGPERGELPLPPPADDSGNGRWDRRSRRQPRAVTVQMEPPPTSVARKLRLTAGQMAVLVTVLFGDGSGHGPTALTTAVLRPDMFRITVETATPEAGGRSRQAGWSLAAADDAP